jgi:hypothetical protein
MGLETSGTLTEFGQNSNPASVDSASQTVSGACVDSASQTVSGACVDAASQTLIRDSCPRTDVIEFQSSRGPKKVSCFLLIWEEDRLLGDTFK